MIASYFLIVSLIVYSIFATNIYFSAINSLLKTSCKINVKLSDLYTVNLMSLKVEAHGCYPSATPQPVDEQCSAPLNSTPRKNQPPLATVTNTLIWRFLTYQTFRIRSPWASSATVSGCRHCRCCRRSVTHCCLGPFLRRCCCLRPAIIIHEIALPFPHQQRLPKTSASNKFHFQLTIFPPPFDEFQRLHGFSLSTKNLRRYYF